jgi:hypothetical protein
VPLGISRLFAWHAAGLLQTRHANQRDGKLAGTLEVFRCDYEVTLKTAPELSDIPAFELTLTL